MAELRLEKAVSDSTLILSTHTKNSDALRQFESIDKLFFVDSSNVPTFLLYIDKAHYNQFSGIISSAVQTYDAEQRKEQSKKEIAVPVERPEEKVFDNVTYLKREPSESSSATASSMSSLKALVPQRNDAEPVVLKNVFERMIEWHSSKEAASKRKVQKRGDIALSSTSFSSGSGNIQTEEVVYEKHVHCIKIMEEILMSEKDYVLDLSTLVNNYMRPLTEKSKDFGNEEGVRLIFTNVAPILEVNAELLKALSDGVNKIGAREKYPSIEAVASVFAKEFLRHMAFLKMYSLYCHQYKSGLAKLDELRSNQVEFDQFLRKCEEEAGNPGGLQSLLIKPVQRICKYPLLFRELFKTMKGTEENRGKEDVLFSQVVQHIENTLQGIEKIASSVNDKVQDIENQQLVLQVFLELGGTLKSSTSNPKTDEKAILREILAPTRRFKGAFEVLLREYSHRNPSRRISCVLYLFNDLLILAKLNQSQSILGIIGSRRASSYSSNNNNSSYLSSNSAGNSVSTNGNKGTLRQRAKLLYMYDLNLHNVRVKKSTGVVLYDEQKRCAFELLVSFSTESEISKPDSSPVSHELSECSSGERRFQSGVDKFDVWCDDRSIRDTLANEIAQKIHECQKQKMQRADVKKAGKRICAEELRRSFSAESQYGKTPSVDTTNTNSLRERRVARLLDMKQNISSLTADSISEQLGKLQQKYITVASHYSTLQSKNSYVKEFSVTFEEGMLGIALQNGFDFEGKSGEIDEDSKISSAVPGVFVATVADNGQAAKKGVMVGDKLISIQNEVLNDDATWKQVFNLMAELPRPITLRFIRTA